MRKGTKKLFCLFPTLLLQFWKEVWIIHNDFSPKRKYWSSFMMRPTSLILNIDLLSWSKIFFHLHDETNGLFWVLLRFFFHQTHLTILLPLLQASEQERKHYHQHQKTSLLHIQKLSLTQILTSHWCAEDPDSSSTHSCSSPPWCWCLPAGSCCEGSSSRCHSASGSQRSCPWNATKSLAFFQQVDPHPARKLDSDQDSLLLPLMPLHHPAYLCGGSQGAYHRVLGVLSLWKRDPKASGWRQSQPTETICLIVITEKWLSYHEGEEDGGLFHGLDYPESHKTANLDHGVEMNPAQLNLTQIGVVRLELLGHKEEKDPVKKL